MEKYIIKYIEDFLNIDFIFKNNPVFFEDTFFKKRELLMNEFEKIIQSGDFSYKNIIPFIKKTSLFFDELSLFDSKLVKCINIGDHHDKVMTCLVETYLEHFYICRSIVRISYLFMNLSYFEKLSYCKSLHDSSVKRLNISFEECQDGFLRLEFFKKYSINNAIYFSLNPSSGYFYENTLNLFDISVLRTLFLMYDKKIFCFNYKSLFKSLSGSDSDLFTENQKKLIHDSINKLSNIDIFIYNRDNRYIKEKLIHVIKIKSKDKYLIMKEPIFYSISNFYDFFVDMDINIIKCPISTTKNNVIIKEYLIYRVFFSKSNNIVFYYDEIYRLISQPSLQNKMRSRNITHRILDYWKSHNYIKDYTVLKNKNAFLKILIVK